MPGLGQELRGVANSLCSQAMSRCNAAVHAFSGSRRCETFGSVVRSEIAVWEEPKLRALEHLQFMWATYDDERRATGSGFQSQ